jgi:hypothetical protein
MERIRIGWRMCSSQTAAKGYQSAGARFHLLFTALRNPF